GGRVVDVAGYAARTILAGDIAEYRASIVHCELGRAGCHTGERSARSTHRSATVAHSRTAVGPNRHRTLAAHIDNVLLIADHPHAICIGAGATGDRTVDIHRHHASALRPFALRIDTSGSRSGSLNGARLCHRDILSVARPACT